MNLAYLVPVTLCLGWMLSPDVFVRLGHAAGGNPSLFVLGLLFAALLAARTSSLIRHPHLQVQATVNLTALLIDGVGPTVATTLLVACRTALVVLIPIGVLVTSGYAFNEIFVYWFPNFGFAYLLLALIAVLHLVNELVAKKAQAVFAALVVISMLTLCVAGILTMSSSPVAVDSAPFSAPLLIGSLLLFLGLEFSREAAGNDSHFAPTGAILVGLLLFAVWSIISVHHVAADRLSGTTIPHLITARAILGDTGRVLMGITIIAGTCGVVNALFHLAVGSFRDLAKQGLLPGHPQGDLLRCRYVILFTLIIGVLMGKGLAGYEILDTYIQATLLLWLFVTGVQGFSAAKLLNNRRVKHSWHGYAIMSVYTFAIIYLIVSDPEAITIVRFLGLALLATWIVTLLWLRRRPVKECGTIHPNKGAQ